MKTSCWWRALAALVCSVGCGERPELVVVVDTDAPVAGELAERPELSPDATVDALRFDTLDTNGAIYDLRTFLVAEDANWPLSFGIIPAPGASEVRLRIRLFRGLFASETVENGISTFEPPPAVTIDRLVWAPLPTSGVERVRVTLAADCIGSSASFSEPPTTCVDPERPAADPSTGIERVDSDHPGSRVGTSSLGVEVPCSRASHDDQSCIAGGFFILGDLEAVGFGQTTGAEPIPLRPTSVSPFFLDAHEFSVGRLRSLAQAGSPLAALPTPYDASDSFNRFCTWLGPDAATNDALPVNCIDYAAAKSICQAVGGSLPTEAQWEYASRGRGQRRLYPWGDDPPQCCSASISRTGTFGAKLAECSGLGPEPVGSHPGSADCPGDVTRDGVFDMAGSVNEALADDFVAYSEGCWVASPLLHDPSCVAAGAPHASRGAYWDAGLATLLLPIRDDYVTGTGQGFRCAYGDTP